ncbi:MAG: hypothetical protein PHO37_10165 [Kiritimatiellae bacterium]|nr:hypothetical protein [Kiritimatiellia bacterium]
MRATANNRRAIRLRTLVSRIATDLLAPHLAGTRPPSDWQVEAVGRLAVTAPAGDSGVQCESKLQGMRQPSDWQVEAVGRWP